MYSPDGTHKKLLAQKLPLSFDGTQDFAAHQKQIKEKTIKTWQDQGLNLNQKNYDKTIKILEEMRDILLPFQYLPCRGNSCICLPRHLSYELNDGLQGDLQGQHCCWLLPLMQSSCHSSLYCERM